MCKSKAFTLIEILIVVVLLGILAAIVVPQFSNATQESKLRATLEQLHHLRNALDVYGVQHNNQFPAVVAGDATWAELNTMGYLKRSPLNNWVGGDNATHISVGDAADSAYHTAYGWIYKAPTAATGPMVWAAGFDAADEPFDP
ncbi:MAG: type II secretion system protein [Phycisphaerales bacterium]|nr:type II secretion system protein [Phycisphaerales bacterium]